MTKAQQKGLFDDLDENKDGMFDNLEDSKNGLFSGLKIGKSAGGMMQGLAAKFKGKKKEEKEEEEKGKEAEGKGLLSEDGDEEEEEEDEEDDDDDEEEDDEDDDDAVAGPAVEGSYDAAEWDHLEVSKEEKELFEYIHRYTPQKVDLETKFKPFIPDYIPAVGDIDAFIKVMRCEHDTETLGLTVLDEPAALQSDPTILDLQLRSVSKKTSRAGSRVKRVVDPAAQAKVVEKWISDIEELHRNQPPPTIQYSKPMPDIDHLMQEWPQQFEEILQRSTLPASNMSLTLQSYVDVICSLLDIPVYKSRVQALHVLFTLFLAFRNSEHFGFAGEQIESQETLNLL